MTYDTIAAIATPPGKGGIGIIRISGPDAERILNDVFRPLSHFSGIFSRDSRRDESGFQWESHKMVYGRLMDGKEMLDEAMAVLMRSPNSYTREDVAELQLHGNSFLLSEALQLCVSRGARMADPGEFTRRAFRNGRIDLSQAEAVMSLIQSETREQQRAAIRQLEGGASSFVRSLSEKLLDLQAGLTACIDYPEEVSDEEGCASLRPGLESLLKELDSSIDERSSHLLYDGLHVTLFGRPNGGKSSLLNLLTGEDRAIVTSIPGTTRDVLEGSILLDGIQIHLTDTAGLRSTEDPIERIGVARSKKAIEQADIRILILDGSETLSQEDEKHLLSLEEKDAVVINKSDLPQCIDPEEIKGIFLKRVSNAAPQILSVSALDEASLFPLKEFLRQSGAIHSGLSVTSPRHLSALRSASKHLHDALLSLEAHCPPDLISIDLQSAQSTLCEITGETAGEKLLDRVFSTFCVGK